MEIIDYPNYLIYNDGRVYSKKRNKFLKPWINKDKRRPEEKKGYWTINVCSNNKRKMFEIHRLIAIHYIPNPNNYKFVDHINRDTLDNRIENLRWVTHSMNAINIEQRKDNTSGHKNIRDLGWGFIVEIRRNKKLYIKCKKTLEDAIKQRDLMLSMWS